MKLGVTIPTRTVALDRVPEYARWASDAGFDSLWDYEIYRNPFTMLATAASTTERIALGTGIAATPSRSPFEMANAAADVDELSGGRTLLGIGTGVTDFMGAFHGAPTDHPLSRISEYIDVLHRSWQYLETGDAPTYEGEYFGFTAPPFNPWGGRHVERSRIPVYLGAIGPRMLRLVGRKADGWIGYLATPEMVRDHVRPLIAEGAAQAGRDVADVDLTLDLITVISPDPEVARARARRQVGFYVAHPSSDPIVQYAGLQDEVGELRAALGTEGFAAFERTSDKIVDTFTLTGTPDEVRHRTAAWEGVVDHLVLHTPYVPPFTAEESEDSYRNIVDTFGR